MKQRIVVLGAGFGGLELATTLSEALGDGVAVTLIDKAEALVLGYSKLDVLFGRPLSAPARDGRRAGRTRRPGSTGAGPDRAPPRAP
jgi:sulfide:quinone oxidoreductase